MEVPEWNQLYPSLYSANKQQREFYKILEKSLEQNQKTDVKGSISYLFVYLYKIVQRLLKTKDINKLIEKFEMLQNFYGDYEKVETYLAHWQKDAYLFVGNFEKAWEATIKCNYVTLADIINIRGNCEETSIDSKTLFKILMSDNGLSQFGRENKEEVGLLVDIFLKDFYFEHKQNYAEYFLKRYNYNILTEENFQELKDFYPSEKDFLTWKQGYLDIQKSKKPYPKKYHHYIFSGAPLDDKPFFERQEIPHIVSVALGNEFKRIIREAENTVRTERNLPKVGEGWISEADLYYKLASTFKDEKVKHHGKPHWIGRQHLDIYLPEKNIAIEYQGAQHQMPVSYFGGEEAYIKQVAMDKKKRKLCEKNDCHLIYVYPDYDFEELTNQILTLL